MPRCFKCGSEIGNVIATGTEIHIPLGKSTRGFLYSCPVCQAVLGCEMDPTIIRNELAGQIAQMLTGNSGNGPPSDPQREMRPGKLRGIRPKT